MKRKKKKPAAEPKKNRDESRKAPQSPADEGTPEDSGSPEENRISELEEQAAELTDRLQRKTAEFANYQKRIRKEMDETRKYAAGPMALELLTVLDSFDRALDSVDEGKEDWDDGKKEFLQGLILIQEQFRTALANHSIVPIEALGAPFDPNSHDAIMEEENPDLPDRTVMDELVKGYVLHDRLLRPARVRVARTPKAVPAEEGTDRDGCADDSGSEYDGEQDGGTTEETGSRDSETDRN